MVDERICKAEGCNKRAGAKDSLCPMHRARLHRNGTLEYVGRKSVPLDSAIEARIMRASDDECWAWSGYRDPLGYPKLRRGSKNVVVHRWIYEKYVGPLDADLVIDHACRNTGCLNPAHLRQISQQGNTEHFTTPLRAHNTSGHRGVSFHKASGLWMARVTVKGTTRATYHPTLKDAAEAAVQMRREMHTFNDLDR